VPNPAVNDYRWGGIAATRGSSQTTGQRGQHIELLNLDIQGLGLRVTGSILNRQGIGGVFFWRDLHAAVVRGPNRVVLRLELHSLGVGHAITELYRLAAVNDACAAVETLDG